MADKPKPPHYDTMRTLAISDGLFSITLVLLVFGLDVPTPAPDTPGLFETLQTYSPELIGYVVGAVYVGMMWIKHHHLLHAYKCLDTIFMAINFVFMTVVMLVPYFLGLMLLYIDTDDARLSALMYSGCALLSVFLFQAMLRYGRRTNLMEPDVDKTYVRTLYWNTDVMLVLYLLAVGISFISPILTLAAHFVIALFVVGLLWWKTHRILQQPAPPLAQGAD